MGAAAAAPKRELTWLHVFLAFTGGLLFAVPMAKSISSRTRVALTGAASGPPVAPGASGIGEAGNAPHHFCPWDTRHSVFQKPSKVINFRNNQTACLDAILYGMDIVWEKLRLFRRTKWLGVPMQQDSNDAQIIQEMLWKVKPDVLIELGTNTGGGAVYFASIMSLIGKGRVITIDPNDFHQPWLEGNNCPDDDPCLRADESKFWQERVTFIQGMPDDPIVLESVRRLLKEWGAKTVMVSEDSSHNYDAVISNLRAYWQFVTKGSYLLVQDTKLTRFAKSKACAAHATEREQDSCWDGMQSGPGDAIKTFQAENDSFEVDTSLEFLLYSQHAGGFLRRVR